MTGRARDAADVVLALLTATVWCSTYVLYFMRDPVVRRRWHLLAWRLRQRLRLRPQRSRPMPAALASRLPPRAQAAPSRRATSSARTASQAAASREVEFAEPVRIAEWRTDNLPLRYRLLGRVRRGANDN